jgi:hypothetical protein
MRQRGIYLLLTLCLAALAAGCGGSGKNIGSAGSLPPASVVGRAHVSGAIFAPSGIDTTSAARAAAQGNSWKTTAVAYAEVALYTMAADGSLIPLGDQYTALTDADGNFTLYYVPPVNNVIAVGTKDVKVNGQTKKLKVSKFLSILNKDVITGSLNSGDTDAASTLAVAAMYDILDTLNASLPPNQRLTGADLPPETLASILAEIETALAADMASGNPAVDLVELTTHGLNSPNSAASQAASEQLDNLMNSPSGATLSTLITNAATTGSVRVTTINTSGAAVSGASVSITVSGTTTTKTADTNGQALFGGLTPGAAATITVRATGYSTATASATVPAAGRVTDVSVTLTPVDTSVTASVTGTITDKNTGAPIADAVVKIYADGFVDIVLTDAAGLYSFFNVPAGSYYLIATKGGYTLEAKTVVVQ